MNAKQVNLARKRLATESEKLIRSIHRNRAAAEEITTENTEDEGDLATISHNKELLYNLHESDFARLRFIGDINERRLLAVPWAALCIRCQEETEMSDISSRLVLAGEDEQTDF